MIFDKKRRVAVSGRALFCVFAGWLNAVLAVMKADRCFTAGPRNIESGQKLIKMPEFCLPNRPKSMHTEAKVDKNRAKCLNLVYRADRNRCAQRQESTKNRSKCLNLVYRPDEDSARRSENRPDSVVRTKTTLPEIIKASVHISIRGTLYPCGGTKKKQ